MLGPQAASSSGFSSRAWYSAKISEFLRARPQHIIGQLVTNSGFADRPTQKDAWLAQIGLLQKYLAGTEGSLFLEFMIPRMGRRIDTVLLIGPVVFVIEFKVGDRQFERAAMDQTWDYALDLKNFHEASHAVSIVPILIATEATQAQALELCADEDKVYRPICQNPEQLRQVIIESLRAITGETFNHEDWARAPYRPTPTIIEAARTLYSHHSVEAIARHDAGATNLRITSSRIEQLADEARAFRRKAICFVTGVPGAGKTLVGLNVATRRREVDQPTHAVFLSGNGPLVAVLRAALTRDEIVRRKSQGAQLPERKTACSVKAFIQNVHHFRDDALADPRPPAEHIAIFDEAQRAWNLRQTANFMQRRKKRPGFSQSEPEFLISCMDRHDDWAAIVCLVGGGQEINRGEAGIDAWLEAVTARFPHWDMHISSRLTDSEYAAGRAIEAIRGRQNTHFDDCLHLAVPMRSFRAENVSAFVKALLDFDERAARDALSEVAERYPIAVTRSLDRAKDWVRSRARGTERYGLVASSKAQRLKPHAIDIRVPVNPVHWFLNGKEDTRSSYYLEDAATEFQVQGLEVDWSCVTWDADLRLAECGWSFHDFRGERWCNILNEANRKYLLNAYRVLLTRARQGMIIFVPPGDRTDPTRRPEYYDPTFRFLTQIGIRCV